MGETETTTPAIEETSPAATSNSAEEETTIAPEETSAAEEVTSAAGTSSDETSGAASLDTGADQETTSSGTSQETETQPSAGEDASSPSEGDIIISCPDYSGVLGDIYVVAEGQKVLLEDFIAGRTEEQLQTAELNAQRFDLLTQKLDHQSEQLEACISIMFIFIVVMVLNYCYKFLRMFF